MRSFLLGKTWVGIVVRVCLVLIILLIPFRLNYRLIRMDGDSMSMAYVHDQFVVMRYHTSLGTQWVPERFDVVVIDASNVPGSGRYWWVKRVIGLPGEEVYAEHGVIYVNSVPVDNTSFVNPVNLIFLNISKFIVPPNSYWVIGDFSGESEFGVFNIETIVGKVVN